MQDNFDILSKAAAGDKLAEQMAIGILLNANRAFFCNGFELSMERFCGIPQAKGKLLNQKRNFWLRRAHSYCQGATCWEKSKALSKEIETFKSVLWPKWKNLGDVPAGASELRKSLFEAMKIAMTIKSDKVDLKIPNTARMIHNIVKDSA